MFNVAASCLVLCALLTYVVVFSILVQGLTIGLVVRGRRGSFRCGRPQP